MAGLTKTSDQSSRYLSALLVLFISLEAVLSQISLKEGYGKYAELQVSLAPGDSYHIPLSRIFQMGKSQNPRFTSSGSCGGKVSLSQLTTQLSVQRIAMPDGMSIELATAFGRYLAFYKFTGNLVQMFTFNPNPTEPKEFISDGPYNIVLGSEPLSCVTPLFVGGSVSRIFLPCSDRLLIFKPTLDEVAGVVPFGQVLTLNKDTKDNQVVVLPEQDLLVGVSAAPLNALWYCSNLSANRLIDIACGAQYLKWQHESQAPAQSWNLQGLTKVGSGILAFWMDGNVQRVMLCKVDSEALVAKCAPVTSVIGGTTADTSNYRVSKLEVEDPAGGTSSGAMLAITDLKKSQYLLGVFREDKLIIEITTKILGIASLDEANRIYMSSQGQITSVGDNIADIRGRVHTGSIIVIGERAIQRVGNQIRLYTLEPEFLLINGLSSKSEPEASCNITISAFDDLSYDSVDVSVEIYLQSSSQGSQRSKGTSYSLELCPKSELSLQFLAMDGSNYFTPRPTSSDPAKVLVKALPYDSSLTLSLAESAKSADQTLLLSSNLLLAFQNDTLTWYFCAEGQTPNPKSRLNCETQMGSYKHGRPFEGYSAVLGVGGRVAVLTNAGVVCHVASGRCVRVLPEQAAVWGVGKDGSVASAWPTDGFELIFRLVAGANQVGVWKVSYLDILAVELIAVIDKSSTVHGQFSPVAICAESASLSSSVGLAIWSKTNDPSQVLHLKFEFATWIKDMRVTPISEQFIENSPITTFITCVSTTRFLTKDKTGLFLRDYKSKEALDQTRFESETCKTDETKLQIIQSSPTQDSIATISPCTSGTLSNQKLTVWGLATAGYSASRRYLGSIYVTSTPNAITRKGAHFYVSSSKSSIVYLLSTIPGVSVAILAAENAQQQSELTQASISISLPPTKLSAAISISSATPEPLSMQVSAAQDYFIPEKEYSLHSRIQIEKGHVFAVRIPAVGGDSDTQSAVITRSVFTETADGTTQTRTLSLKEYYESIIVTGDQLTDRAIVSARECVNSKDCVTAAVYLLPAMGEYVLRVQRGEQFIETLLGKGDGAFRAISLVILGGDSKNVSLIVQKEAKAIYTSVLFGINPKVQLAQSFDLQSAVVYSAISGPMLVGISSLDSQTIQVSQPKQDTLKIELANFALISRPVGIITPAYINCQTANGCVIWSLASRTIYSFDPAASMAEKKISEHFLPEGLVQKSSVLVGECVVSLTEDTESQNSNVLVAYRRTSSYAIGVKPIAAQVQTITTKRESEQSKVFLNLAPQISTEGMITLKTMSFSLQNDTLFKISKSTKSDDPRLVSTALTLTVSGSPKLSPTDKTISMADLFKKTDSKPPVNPDKPAETGSSGLYWVIGIVSVVLAVVSAALVYTSCKLNQAKEANLDGETDSKESLIRRKVPNGESTLQNDSAHETHTDL